MRDEYNISELNPRKNPYTNRLKKQVTINIDNDTVNYFKKQSEKGCSCVRNQKEISAERRSGHFTFH